MISGKFSKNLSEKYVDAKLEINDLGKDSHSKKFNFLIFKDKLHEFIDEMEYAQQILNKY